MPQIKADFGNSVAAFKQSTQVLSSNVRKLIEKAIKKEAERIINVMESKTRVRTGRLRRNWRLTKRGSGKFTRYSLINRTPYGVYTTTNTTASKGGTYLADELAKQLRLGEARLNKTVKKILAKEARNFNS